MQLVKDKYLYITFLWCTLIAGVVYGYYMITSGGVFTLFADYNLQQIPFACAANEAIKSGSQWDWCIDYGTSVIASFSFYNLGSPFFWITLPFSPKAYPYLMGWLFILKYAVAGATAYAYMTYFLKERKWGVLAGILYSFSGFQSVNIMFFHFHDVVALFPLLLIGIEQYIRKDKKIFLIISVCINAMVNYFFFVGEVVFVGLYYIARCVDFSDKEKFWCFIKRGLACVAYAAVGVAMASVIFVPSVIFILGNRRASAGMPGLFYDRSHFLNVCRAFIWPIDIQNNHATINAGDWNSISVYLPLWGISLAIAYVVKKIQKKDRLAILTVGLVVMSFIPFLNAVFYGFTEATYKRWWYMLVLMLSLMSAKVLESRKEYNIRLAVGVNAALSLLFLAVILGLKLVLVPEVFALNVVVIILGLVCAFILATPRAGYRIIVLLTACFAFFTTFFTVHLYRGDNSSDDYMTVFDAGIALEEIDPQYRYNTSHNMFGILGNVGNMGVFSSTVSNSIAEFHGNLGIYRESFSPYTTDHMYMRQLLAGKYEIVGSSEGLEIVESDDVSPIGYAVSTYVTESELCEYAMLNGYDEGMKLLLKSAAVMDNDVSNYDLDSIMKHNISVEEDVLDLVRTNQKNKVDDFTRTRKGFTCTTNYDTESAVYFSIPYDSGWSAKINGMKTDILSSNGMMLIIVPSGVNSVEFMYMTPGLIWGCILSILGLFILGFVVYKERKTNAF